MYFLRLIIAVWYAEAALGARILGIFPTPSISHQVVFRALTHELAKRGHELIILTPDPARLHPNITEIDAHDVSYSMWTTEFMNKVMEDERNGVRTLLRTFRYFHDFTLKMFDTQMSLPEVQDLLRSNEDFDLIMVESMFRMTHAIRHKFKAPLISVSSMGGFTYNFDAMGIPSHPLLYPDCLTERTPYKTLMEKMYAIYFHASKYYYGLSFVKRANKLTRKYFGADTPDLLEMEAQTDMMFLNVNPIWDGIRPTPPNVIYMWGTHLKPTKKLPADIKIYLDNSTRGVVYMSLGSNIKSSELSQDRQSMFLEVFRRLPYDVLWKWEADTLPDISDNVRIEKWLPQSDLLHHPNVKAFITQGGLQSIDEALSTGVPLIGIPFMGDQVNNVAKFEKHGVGVSLDINTVTADQLERTVIAVVQTDKYRAAVRRISKLLIDNVDGGIGVTRAASWAEYVIRHGGAAHLRSPGAGVSFSEYFVLDVVAVVALATALLVLVLVVAVFRLYNKLTRRLSYKIKKRID